MFGLLPLITDYQFQGFRVSGFGCAELASLGSGFQGFRVSGSRFKVSGFKVSVKGIRCSVFGVSVVIIY